MDNNNQLVIGMPAGSLANPNRGGNLIKFLEDSGFKTTGYEKGGPSSFSTVNFLFGWDGRPQEFGAQLGIGELDVAIAGDDWIYERVLELKLEYGTDIAPQKIQTLKRGGVRIVGIVNNDNDFNSTEEFLKDLCSRKKLITVVSEMPYLALNWLQDALKKIGLYEKFSNFSVQKYKTPAKVESGLVIYETWGKTEAKIKNGGADIGLEITQTGSAIRNYGLKIIDTIMESESGVWINPNIKNDETKLDLLRMFLLNLYGTLNAENKVMVMFNIGKEYADKIHSYLDENNLFADEPTINKGEEYYEYSIQVDISDEKTPVARIRYMLAKLGARNIDTIPINSSIPGINVINFLD